MTWKRRLRLIAMLIFVGSFVALVYHQKSNAVRVLVLHSYNTDYAWVNQINEGVARAFDARPHVQVLHHYMDLKNHTDAAFRRTAASLSHRVIDEWEPDVLVVFDDVAQQLVGREYAATPGEPARFAVVFGGVNGVPETYYGDAGNVTGILERKPLDAIRDTVLALVDVRKRAPQVQYIGDLSPSITAEIPFYSTIDWDPLVWRTPVQVDTFDAWKDAVRRAGDTADLILLTNYQQVRDGAGWALRAACIAGDAMDRSQRVGPRAGRRLVQQPGWRDVDRVGVALRAGRDRRAAGAGSDRRRAACVAGRDPAAAIHGPCLRAVDGKAGYRSAAFL